MCAEAVLKGKASTGKTNKAFFFFCAFSCRHDTSVHHSSRIHWKAATFNEMFILLSLQARISQHAHGKITSNQQRSCRSGVGGRGVFLHKSAETTAHNGPTSPTLSWRHHGFLLFSVNESWRCSNEAPRALRWSRVVIWWSTRTIFLKSRVVWIKNIWVRFLSIETLKRCSRQQVANVSN